MSGLARASLFLIHRRARIDLPVENIEKCPSTRSRMIKCRDSYDVLRAREGSCIDRTVRLSVRRVRVKATTRLQSAFLLPLEPMFERREMRNLFNGI